MPKYTVPLRAEPGRAGLTADVYPFGGGSPAAGGLSLTDAGGGAYVFDSAGLTGLHEVVVRDGAAVLGSAPLDPAVSAVAGHPAAGVVRPSETEATAETGADDGFNVGSDPTNLGGQYLRVGKDAGFAYAAAARLAVPPQLAAGERPLLATLRATVPSPPPAGASATEADVYLAPSTGPLPDSGIVFNNRRAEVVGGAGRGPFRWSIPAAPGGVSLDLPPAEVAAAGGGPHVEVWIVSPSGQPDAFTELRSFEGGGGVALSLSYAPAAAGPSDVAAAVWSAASRTLTGFGSLPSLVWQATARTLTAEADPPGVTTLLGRISSVVAARLPTVARIEDLPPAVTPASVGVPGGQTIAHTGNAASFQGGGSGGGATASELAAAVLLTPANKLATGADGSVTAAGLAELAAKLTGIGSLRDWLRAALRSDAADPTGGEIGGGYDATTDSLEAVRDAGDAGGFGTLVYEVRAAVHLVTTSGVIANYAVWLLRNGEPIDPTSLDADATAALRIREHGGGADAVDVSFVADDLNGVRFEASAPDPGFAADREYAVTAEVEADGVVYAGLTSVQVLA